MFSKPNDSNGRSSSKTCIGPFAPEREAKEEKEKKEVDLHPDYLEVRVRGGVE